MSCRALLALTVAGATALASPDAGEPRVPDAGAPAALEELEAFAPAQSAPGLESFAAAPSGPVVRMFGQARALVGVDTQFESSEPGPLAEHVFELRGRARLGADVKLTDAVRVVVEGRALWRVAVQRGFARGKATFEPSLGEAFVDVYSPAMDLRVGSQVLGFGANPALAPADALNPRDLREGFLLSEPEDSKLPVFAVRATGTLGKVQWTAAYVPFFVPHRYDVFGQDQALIQPAMGVLARIPSQLSPSIEDGLQPHLLETERPADFGWLGDLGLRATAQVGRATVGLSWVFANEKLPQLTLDEELSTFLEEQAAGRDDAPLLASLRERFEAGEQLVTGRYARQHLASLEGSFLLGSTQVDLDLSYSPAQTFYDLRGRPLRKGAVTWVASVSQAQDSRLVYSVGYLGMAIPGLASEELVALVEPTTARGAARTGWFHLFLGTVAYRFFDDRLEVSLRAAFEPIQRSLALAPRVRYSPTERFQLFLAAEVLQGPALSPFGYFNRNDQVMLGVSGDFL